MAVVSGLRKASQRWVACVGNGFNHGVFFRFCCRAARDPPDTEMDVAMRRATHLRAYYSAAGIGGDNLNLSNCKRFADIDNKA
jgi:hypothetical protein